MMDFYVRLHYFPFFYNNYVFIFSSIELHIIVQGRNDAHRVQWDHKLLLSVHCFS